MAYAHHLVVGQPSSLEIQLTMVCHSPAWVCSPLLRSCNFNQPETVLGRWCCKERCFTSSLRRIRRRGRQSNAMQPSCCLASLPEPLAGLQTLAHCIACCNHLDMSLEAADVARHRNGVPSALLMSWPTSQSQIFDLGSRRPPCLRKTSEVASTPSDSSAACARLVGSPSRAHHRLEEAHTPVHPSSAPQGRLHCSFRSLPAARHSAPNLVELTTLVKGIPSSLVNRSSGRRLWLHICKRCDRAA